MTTEIDAQSESPNAETHVAAPVLVCLVSQGLFWYFSSPGPQLRGETGLASAGLHCLFAVLTLMAIPLWGLRINRGLFDVGFLGTGDRSFGIRAILVLSPVFVLGTFIGSGDQQIIDFYPMPGYQIGADMTQMLVWFCLYLFYYIAFEFFYRGVMLQGFRTFGMVAAIFLQTVFCLVIHLGKPTIEVWASIPASIVFGWIAWRTRSIWYGFVIHYLVGIANDLGALWQGSDVDLP